MAGQDSDGTPVGIQLVAVEPNISDAYFEREREAVFRNVWLKVGRVEELAAPGDYLLREFAAPRASLVVLRGSDGELRAFHNVCRHRGNCVVRTPRGNANRFVCGFHGWTYDNRGELAHVPQEEEFGGIDKGSLGLLPVALEVWEGFIFVHLDPEPDESLLEYLGDVGGLVRGVPFSEMELAGHWTASIESNWKTFQDAFVEAYHVATVHRRSIPDYRKGPVKADLETFGRHGNLTFYLDIHAAPSPAAGWAFQASNLAFLRGSQDGSGSPGDVGEPVESNRPAGVNRAHRENWIFDEFLIFPNFHLFVGDGWVLCHDFEPVSAHRTDWSVRYYLQRTENPVVRIAQEYSKVTMRDTIREDLSTIESTHAAHRSGVLTHMVLSTELEGLIAHHHAVVDGYVASAEEGE